MIFSENISIVKSVKAIDNYKVLIMSGLDMKVGIN